MTIGNIPRTRLKFLDKETSLTPQDLSEITSNLPINDAKALFDSSLNKLPDLKKELAALSSPLGPVQQALNSGAAASQALADIQKTVQANLPDMRSVSASITAVTTNTLSHAKNLSQSVTGHINQALSAVPAVIGKVDQLSQHVKSEILKSSVNEFVQQVTQTSKTILETGALVDAAVKNTQSAVKAATNQIRQTTSQLNAQRAIQASHQSLSSSMGPINLLALQTTGETQFPAQQRSSTPPLGPTPSTLPPTNAFSPSLEKNDSHSLTPHQLQNQNLATQIQKTLEGLPTFAPVSGTTSALPPVTYSNEHHVAAEPVPQILYNDHALRFMVTACTWFRALSSWEYQFFPDLLVLRYGTGQQLFDTLSKDPTGIDRHKEQLQNTLHAFATTNPDEPNKLLWMTRNFQEVVRLSIESLQQRKMTNEMVGWLNQLVGVLRLSDYLDTQGLEKHLQDRKELVFAVVNNLYRIQDQSDSDRLIYDAFTQLTTHLLFYHRTNPKPVGFRPSTPTRLAVIALLSLMRDLIVAGVQNETVHLALNTLTNLPLELMRVAYSDGSGAVIKDHPVCWKPSAKACVELPIPLIRHYRSQKTNLLRGRDSLINAQEHQLFDAIITQMQILENAGLAAFDAIWNYTHPYQYLNPTAEQQDLVGELCRQMVEGRYHFQDTVNLPPYCFETYAVDVEQMYVDDSTIVLF